VDDIETPTILICSHGQRDSRCGILGPLLHREFQDYINDRTVPVAEGTDARKYIAQTQKFASKSTSAASEASGSSSSSASTPTTTTRIPMPVNIGTISHVGGHKWAGNVIVYTPPNATVPTPTASTHHDRHPLAGKGIWYGRIEPCHVQGIVEETVLRGRVIRDLFRGGIDEHGAVIRL